MDIDWIALEVGWIGLDWKLHIFVELHWIGIVHVSIVEKLDWIALGWFGCV